jgi:hypothetical protein
LQLPHSSAIRVAFPASSISAFLSVAFRSF